MPTMSAIQLQAELRLQAAISAAYRSGFRGWGWPAPKTLAEAEAQASAKAEWASALAEVRRAYSAL